MIVDWSTFISGGVDRSIVYQLIVGIVCMHQWWTDIKESASAAIDAVGDVFDRRLEVEEAAGAGGRGVAIAGGAGRQAEVPDKVRRS